MDILARTLPSWPMKAPQTPALVGLVTLMLETAEKGIVRRRVRREPSATRISSLGRSTARTRMNRTRDAEPDTEPEADSAWSVFIRSSDRNESDQRVDPHDQPE